MKLGFLRPLYEQTGRYVSVYLDTNRATEKAPQAVALRWRAARDRLAAAGADGATLAAIGDLVTDPDQAAPGRAVFGRGGSVSFTASLADPPQREIARVAPLPHLMPLLASQPPQPPHLQVTATRAGGDILAVAPAEGDWARHAGRRGWPLHKSPSGGWSQLQHQRSTEEAWEDNAKELATQVMDAAERIGAAQVVVAGDARAQSLLRKHLSSRWQAAVLTVGEEVPPDAGAVAAAAERALARQEDEACRERFGHWQTQLAHGAATQGLAGTLTALADGQVAQLFLADRPATAASAWVGPAGTDLAASEAELRERGVPDPVSERADAAAIRAAAATDAELYILPGDLLAAQQPDVITEPQDGICATLRYPPAS
ncbi:MAG: Vms1/Ankzf1 family peptidyl-tRNA hydrolase [Gemmatimonadota bacterium]